MTKNLNNSEYSRSKEERRPAMGKVAPMLFPLVAVVLGYVIGKQFLGL